MRAGYHHPPSQPLISFSAAVMELICDNSVIDTIIDRFGEDVDISVVDDDTFRVVTEMAVSHVFYGWIFGFGGKVKINAPDTVKANYEKMLKDAMESLS